MWKTRIPGAAVTSDQKASGLVVRASVALNWCPIAEQDQLTVRRNIQFHNINTFFSLFFLQNSHEIKQKKSNIHACTITQEYLHTGKRSPADAAVWNDGDVGGVPAQQNSPIHWVKLEMMNGITSVSNTCDGSQVRTATVTGFLETAGAGWATASKLGASQGCIPPHRHSFVSSTDECSGDHIWPFNRRISTHIKPKQRRTDLFLFLFRICAPYLKLHQTSLQYIWRHRAKNIRPDPKARGW